MSLHRFAGLFGKNLIDLGTRVGTLELSSRDAGCLADVRMKVPFLVGALAFALCLPGCSLSSDSTKSDGRSCARQSSYQGSCGDSPERGSLSRTSSSPASSASRYAEPTKPAGPLGGLLRKSEGSTIPPLTKPMTPAQREAVMSEAGRNFVYSNALGNTALNVGLAVLFPPYIAALVGNGALELAGYEPLSISDAMPETMREYYVSARDGVTSAPGRAVAWTAGEQFRTESMAKKAISSAMLAGDEQPVPKEKR